MVRKSCRYTSSRYLTFDSGAFGKVASPRLPTICANICAATVAQLSRSCSASISRLRTCVRAADADAADDAASIDST